MKNLLNILQQHWDKTLASVVAVLTPLYGLLTSVLILLFLDMVSGIWASYKEGKKITSFKLADTITKLTIYMICLVTLFVSQTFIIQSLPLTLVGAGIIANVEILSILENIKRATGTSLLTTIKSLLKRIKKEPK